MAEESRALRNTFLPREAPSIPGYDLAGGTATHTAGSGDTLWDSFTLRGGRTGVAVLRSNHGSLPAGFHVGLARTLFKGLAPEHDSVDSLMATVNRALSVGAPEATDQVVEGAALVPVDDGVQWTSAGNTPGGIIGRDGTFQEFASQGPPMGVMEGFNYRVTHYPMSVGDACVVLSDGSAGLFKGAADLVAGLVGKPVGDVVATVHKAIRQAQGAETEVSVLFLRKG